MSIDQVAGLLLDQTEILLLRAKKTEDPQDKDILLSVANEHYKYVMLRAQNKSEGDRTLYEALPEYRQALFGVGIVDFERAQNHHALHAFEEIAKQEPDNILVLAYLGEVRRRLGNLPLAKEAFDKVFDLAKMLCDKPETSQHKEAIAIAIDGTNQLPEYIRYNPATPNV